MIARQVQALLAHKQWMQLRTPTTTGLTNLQKMYFACDGSTGGPEVLITMEKKLKEEFDPVEC